MEHTTLVLLIIRFSGDCLNYLIQLFSNYSVKKIIRGSKMLFVDNNRLAAIVLLVFFGFTQMENQYAEAESYKSELEDNWIQPLNGVITDTFGTRNGNHKGIDIAAPEGKEIVTVSSGIVTKSYYSDSYGHVVFVGHPEGYETVYAHLSKRLAAKGDSVKKGQVIGIIGNTGISTGTHLHFEIHKGEWTFDKEHAIDPSFVFNSNTSITTAENVHKDEQVKNVITSTEEIRQKKIIVKNGDTLWKIARLNHVAVKSLMEWNQLNSDLIFPGQRIIVYSKQGEKYVVKAGDTLQSIAEEFSIDPEAIKRVNHLTDETIHPKQVLLISKSE